MIYLCAGVYAEGPTDYAFLLPLVTRLLYELSASVAPLTDVADAVGIDARPPFPSSRADRIARAIADHIGQCTLFVIHADADGDPHAALRERIEPGRRGATAPVVACVPVRELEAWMLADPEVFTTLIATSSPTLPRDPERDGDPKATLTRIVRSLKLPGSLGDYYELFGERVVIDRLRRLPAFKRFEDDLTRAVMSLAPGQSPSEPAV